MSSSYNGAAVTRKVQPDDVVHKQMPNDDGGLGYVRKAGDTYLRHGAEVAYWKRDFTADERQALADKGHALPNGSYPIPDKDALGRAVDSIGRAPDYGRTKAHIIRQARRLDAVDQLPGDWEVEKILRKYSPDEPRDDKGEWTSGAGGAGGGGPSTGVHEHPYGPHGRSTVHDHRGSKGLEHTHGASGITKPPNDAVSETRGFMGNAKYGNVNAMLDSVGMHRHGSELHYAHAPGGGFHADEMHRHHEGQPAARNNYRTKALVEKYSPDQARDDHGKWTAMGGTISGDQNGEHTHSMEPRGRGGLGAAGPLSVTQTRLGAQHMRAGKPTEATATSFTHTHDKVDGSGETHVGHSHSKYEGKTPTGAPDYIESSMPHSHDEDGFAHRDHAQYVENLRRSDHAHGNRPAVHSHTGESGMGFGHTLADHRRRGDLGPPAHRTSTKALTAASASGAALQAQDLDRGPRRRRGY